MANATLAAIRSKVRQITRTPSETQLSTAQLDEYINTFVLQDFPEHLRLFNLKTTLEFYLNPNVADYDTTTAPSTDPLFDFKNRYISVEGPLYINGIQGMIYQSRAQFFTLYPQVLTEQQIATGDGVVTAYSATISGTPILPRSLVVSSTDANNLAITLEDRPQFDLGNAQLGDLIIPDDPSISYGSINYLTGALSVNFPSTPADTKPIIAQYFPYEASRPLACLFYDGVFSFRPVPDQVYRVTMTAFVRPTELLSSVQTPELDEWWQYISWGASKKVFENRMDLDSIAQLQPILDEQERLILRRTLVQNSTQRVATIYQNANNNGGYPGGYFFNNF